MHRSEVDVLVVGGGPAGSAAAAAAARAGASVMLVEAETFPRFHIGESLLPLADRVFHELGIADTLARSGFVSKYGAQLKTPDGGHTVLFDFQQCRHVQPGRAFQVHRAEFDQLLLEHARASGAAIVVGRARDYSTSVEGVDVQIDVGGGIPGASASAVRAKALIDASGRSGFVARREGVREPDPELQKAAVYAHFRGVPVDADVRAGDTRIVSLPNLGWMWFIPLKGDVMSVGVVLDKAVYEASKKGDPAALFWAAVREAPYAEALLRSAQQIGEFAVESGFSYRATRYCGERWFLAGDAGSFLDPIFSTGVQLALRSGVDAAAAAVSTVLRGVSASARARAKFDRALRRRYWFVRRFVTGFYDPATRDIFFAPRRYLGITRAVTSVLAGGFDLGRLDRLRLQVFFGLGFLQRHFDLVPRVANGVAASESRSDVDVVGVQ
jgi:flavin-dependent dehydrogenase